MPAATLKTLVRLLAAVALLVAVVVGGLVATLHHPAVKQWILTKANEVLARELGADLRIGELSGSLLFGLRATDVSLSRQGRQVARAAELRLTYGLLDLVGRRITIKDVAARGLWIDLPGVTSLGQGGGGDGGGVGLRLRRVSLQDAAVDDLAGQVMWPVRSARGLDIAASLELSTKGALTLDADLTAGQAQVAGLRGPVSLSARVRIDGDRLHTDNLCLAAAGALAHGRLGVDWRGDVLLDGQLATDNLTLPWLEPAVSGLPPVLGRKLSLGFKGGMDGLAVSARNEVLRADVGFVFSVTGSELSFSRIGLSAPWGRVSGELVADPAFDDDWPRRADLKLENLALPPEMAPLLPAAMAGARLNGRLTLDQADGRPLCRLTLTDSRLAAWLPLVSLEATGRVGRDLALLSLRADLGWAAVEMAGLLDRLGGDMAARLEVADLAVAAETARQAGLPLDGPYQGRLRATARLSGPWSLPSLQVEAQAEDLVTPNIHARRLELGANLQNPLAGPTGQINLTASEAQSGELLLSQARLDYRREPHQCRLSFDVQGPDLRAAGALSHPGGQWLPSHGQIDQLRVWLFGHGPWTQTAPAHFGLEQGRVSLAPLELTHDGQRIGLSGLVDAAGPVRVQLTVGDLQMAPLAGALPSGLAFGRLSATASLEGELHRPRLAVKGLLDEMAGPKAPDCDLAFDGVFDDRLLSLRGSLSAKGKPALDFRAELGLELSLRPPVFEPTGHGLHCRAWADDLSLTILEPYLPGVGELAGRLDLDLACDGPWRDPRLTGRATLRGGRLTILATGQQLREITLDLTLAGRRLTLERLRAASGPSAPALNLAGSVDFPFGGPGHWNLALTGREVVVGLGDLGWVSVDVDLHLVGPWAAAALEGALRPRKALVRHQMLPPAGMDEIIVLETGQEPPPIGQDQTAWKPGGLLEGWTMDVLVDLSQKPQVSLDEGRLTLDGALRARKRPGGWITYSEAIKLEKGMMLVFGRRIDIDNGVIDFGGKAEIDPALDIDASLNMGTIHVFASIMGTLQEPSVHLSSQPPLNQADLLSTIVFGRPSSELSGTQQEYLSAQALALLGIKGSQEIKRFLGPELAPDVVTVHDSYQYGSSLEAGKYLSDNLYLRYRKNLGEDGGQNVGVEYRFGERYSIESQVGTTRDTGVDVLTNWEWGR